MLALADLIPKSVARAHSYLGAKNVCIRFIDKKTRRNPVADITPQNVLPSLVRSFVIQRFSC